MTGRYLQLSQDQVAALLADPGVADELAFAERETTSASELDIDKSWHLIHFLLNGAAWEGVGAVGEAVLGGEELEGTDAGYGAFRLLRADKVSSIADALADITGEQLWERFDADRVREADIYPDGWSGAEHERTYVLQHYAALQQFFHHASSQRLGVLAYVA